MIHVRLKPLPEDQWEYFDELEKEWKAKLNEELKSIDWIELFKDEAEEIILMKLNELEEEKETINNNIAKHRKKYFSMVEDVPDSEQKEWFLEFWNIMVVKYSFEAELQKIKSTVSRLNHELHAVRRLKGTEIYESKQQEWDEQKQRARERSIEDIVTPYLEMPRRYGQIIRAKCPFHEERTPSFYVYLATNQYHCYGCQKHGDTIGFYMDLKKVDFKTAVMDLA